MNAATFGLGFLRHAACDAGAPPARNSFCLFVGGRAKTSTLGGPGHWLRCWLVREDPWVELLSLREDPWVWCREQS